MLRGCFLVLCLTAFFPIFAIDVIDDTGAVVHLDHAAQRIISLAPDITESLFAVGAGVQIKGVLKGCDFPEQAKSVPVVGAYNGLHLETMIKLHPDLVITWGHFFSRQLKVLKAMGVPVYVTKPIRIEDVAKNMRQLGLLTGHEHLANEKANEFLQQVEAQKQKYFKQKKIDVYYQIGSYSLLTINKESWINQVIELCGGVNVFKTTKSIAPEITWEQLIQRKPQAIISDAPLTTLQKRFKKWTMIPAVQTNHMYSIDPDFIDRAGPRLLQGITQLCQSIDKAREIS